MCGSEQDTVETVPARRLPRVSLVTLKRSVRERLGYSRAVPEGRGQPRTSSFLCGEVRATLLPPRLPTAICFLSIIILPATRGRYFRRQDRCMVRSKMKTSSKKRKMPAQECLHQCINGRKSIYKRTLQNRAVIDFLIKKASWERLCDH